MAISVVRRHRRLVVIGLICAGAVVLALAAALVLSRTIGGNGKSTTADSGEVALAKLAWCDQPNILFQDNSTTDQTELTSWYQVKDQLNFTPYLPPTLPKGSCLALAGGAIHDPIFGGRLSITYELADGTPVSFSEAPKRGNLGDSLQCQASASPATEATPGATPNPTAGAVTTTATATPQTMVCIGAVGNTTVTVASRQSESDVRAIFKALKANIDWVPAVATTTATSGATATTTPTK